MRETTEQVRALVRRSSPVYLLSLAMSSLLLLVALGLGAHMVLVGHGTKLEWGFVAGCGIVGSVGIIPGFSDWVLKVIAAVNPWKRNGSNGKSPPTP